MTSRSSSSHSGRGIDLTTLLITAVASAAAAYATSKIWAPGTLASAAFTPVIVAILKEMLDRPARVVTQVVPVRGVVRSAPPPSSEPVEHDPTLVAPPQPEPDLERVAQQGEISYHSSGPSASARRWRLAIVTGLLGFVVAAVLFTVPELVTGRAVVGGGGTTYFGQQKQSPARPSQTTTVPGRTVTVSPPATVTVPAPQAAPPAPVVTVPPAATTPAPGTTTPAPAPSLTPPPPVQP
ncbi:MAG: hypothetical protein QOE11_2919 [Solirubrobacteraceae bacterium]|jgi:hypothetical protein|nr:hypothetical protein [Solirubrobacteraceae bacterium]